MADHQEYLDLAIEMIAEEGRLVTFGTLGNTAPDNAKPWAGSGIAPISNPISAKAVFIGSLSNESEFGTFINNEELLKSCETFLLVAPVDGIEQSNVVLDEDNKRWRINVVKVLKPADLELLCVMGLSR